MLRLPVAHSELNAIELIWALCKGEVARKNTTFKMADVKRLMEDFLGKVKASHLKAAINHVIKVEDEFWDKEYTENNMPTLYEIERCAFKIKGANDPLSDGDFSEISGFSSSESESE